MSALVYQIFTSTGLITLGLYHLTSTIHHHLKSPTTFSAKPHHPLPLPHHLHLHHHLRHLPLHLTSAALLLSSLHHLLSVTTPDPLLPSHPFSSAASAAVSLLFFLLSLTSLHLPHDLLFSAASAAFFLLSSSSAAPTGATPSLYSHLLSTSSTISLLSSILALSLAVSPRLFIADVALSATVILQGLWALQTGLTLHVDAFVPEGCHRLLDVVAGVEGSTKCDLDESRLRAGAILDFMFVVYVVVVVVVVFGVYALVAKVVGVSARRFGAYEALPNAVVVDGSGGGGGGAASHVQLKTLTGTQA
ncbi:hypothetical protein vseg_015897 [Gypsophila vaccaria]